MNVNDHRPGGVQPYGARNKIPNIQEFMAQLDAEKKERDASIDKELERNQKAGEVKDHANDSKPTRHDTRTVRDPVTGKDVDIRDVKLDFAEAVDNPKVSCARAGHQLEQTAIRIQFR